MTTEPPDSTLTPEDLDEDQHPTGAWSVGERLDVETAAALKAWSEWRTGEDHPV